MSNKRDRQIRFLAGCLVFIIVLCTTPNIEFLHASAANSQAASEGDILEGDVSDGDESGDDSGEDDVSDGDVSGGDTSGGNALIPDSGFAFTITNPESQVYSPGGTFQNIASGGNGTGDISYAITSGDAATVDSSTGVVTFQKAGIVEITAIREKDNIYQEIAASYTLEILHAEQSIAFENESPGILYYGTMEFTNEAKEVENTSVADGMGYGTGEITYTLVSGNDIVTLEDDKLIFKNQGVGIVKVKATKAEDDCYKAATAEYELTIEYPETPADAYCLKGTQKNSESGWYTGDVTISPATGWKISNSNDLTDNEWQDALVLTADKIYEEEKIYLKNETTGVITDVVVVETVKLDKIAPENLNIQYKTSLLEKVIEVITFHYYQAKADVTISAEDSTSLLDTFTYSYIDESGNNNSVREKTVVIEESWRTGNKAAYSFTIPAQFKGKVAFSAKDKAGNEAGNSDDNRIHVVDSIAPVLESGIQYDKIGNLTRTVDTNNETVTVADEQTRYIYNDVLNIALSIKEANFYPEDVVITVERDGKVIQNGNGYVYSADAWTKSEAEDVYTVEFKLGTKEGTAYDGDYRLKLEYADRSGGVMETYQSNVMTVDTTTPAISVEYDNNTAENSIFYGADRKATITVTDRNVRPQEIITTVSAGDVQENDIDFDLSTKMTSWSFNEEAYTWTSEITYDVDANYSFAISTIDMAEHANQADDAFTVDKTAPVADSMKVEYSSSILDRVLKKLYKYYKSDVTVTLTVEDATSGIDYINWYYDRETTASSMNVEKKSGTIAREAIIFSNRGRTATAQFKLPEELLGTAEQLRGSISFEAIDRSGQKSVRMNDSEKVVIVDNIAPTRKVVYSPAIQVVDKTSLLTLEEYSYEENTNAILYYDSDMLLTFEVEEVNFYPEDVNISVTRDGTAVENGDGYIYDVGSWSVNGDKYSVKLQLGVKAGTVCDGDYIVSITYKDRSNNEMLNYISEQITIDTVNPQLSVDWDPDGARSEKDGREYFGEEQTATITITEHNFRADDVEVIVNATDSSEDGISVTDYEDYLRDRSHWSSDGDVHTAEITFSEDANYSFDISYRDLAKREAADYDERFFTVDTEIPENLTIDYSTSLLEIVLHTITFGFYNSHVTVTLTAEDATSGVQQFVYSYLKAADVSQVNTQGEEITIEESDINYEDGGRKAVASFDIPSADLDATHQFNGTVEFRVMDRSGNESEYADNERLVVDNIAPVAVVEYSEPIADTENIAYYNGSIDATITITEANFYKEDVMVTVSKNGGEAQSHPVNWSDINVDTHRGSFELEGDGDYKVNITYKDRSTNEMTAYQSKQLTIDTGSPKIIIEGIKNKVAKNDAVIGFVVTVEDTNLDDSSFKPVLLAEVMNEDGSFTQLDVTDMGELETVQRGNKRTYTVTNLEQDGIYTLNCYARDMSANEMDKILVSASNENCEKVMFSVNREGSTYSLSSMSEDAKKMLGSFTKEAQDVVLTEINATELSNVKITLFKNDQTIVLKEGEDYRMDADGGNGEWYIYTYTIFAKNFGDDGIYRLVVHSEDEAHNIAENTLSEKDLDISFGIDKTPPILTLLSELESGQVYPVENLEVVLETNDNLKLMSVVVYLDGAEYKAWNEVEINEILLQNNEYRFEVSGDSTDAHDLLIVLTDAAGNNTELKISKFYVTTNSWVRFYNNKPLFFGSIGGTAAVAGGFSALIIRRRRKFLKL